MRSPKRCWRRSSGAFSPTAQPRDITALHPVGLGDGETLGANHLAHEGLLRRIICGTFVNSPKIADLALAEKIEGYTLPQGALSQLTREMAAGRPGLLTKTGLHTFVDPRHGGGRQSERAPNDLVELVDFRGEEYLFYKPYAVDVCFLRGTTADEDGNVTMEQEAVFGEMLSEAQATKRCGGIVIVQVRRMAKRGTLPAKQVKIPGILVDLVIVEPDQWQTYLTRFSPSYAGELRVPLSDIEVLQLDPRKVIARRAALELFPGAICNLGSGVATGIANVAAEEDVLDAVCLTNEQGLIGGAPASGGDAGASRNYAAMIDQPYQFDFYDGGGLDLAFLSFAEIDAEGNVNVSRFGGRIVGPGGFINISQNARCVVFCGSFTAGTVEDELARRRDLDRRGWRAAKARAEGRADHLQRKIRARAQAEGALCHRARRVPPRRSRRRAHRDRARRRSRARRAFPHGLSSEDRGRAQDDGQAPLPAAAAWARGRDRKAASARRRLGLAASRRARDRGAMSDASVAQPEIPSAAPIH